MVSAVSTEGKWLGLPQLLLDVIRDAIASFSMPPQVLEEVTQPVKWGAGVWTIAPDAFPIILRSDDIDVRPVLSPPNDTHAPRPVPFPISSSIWISTGTLLTPRCVGMP